MAPKKTTKKGKASDDGAPSMTPLEVATGYGRSLQDYKEWTVPELRVLLKALGIGRLSRATKPAIITAIEAKQREEPELFGEDEDQQQEDEGGDIDDGTDLEYDDDDEVRAAADDAAQVKKWNAKSVLEGTWKINPESKPMSRVDALFPEANRKSTGSVRKPTKSIGKPPGSIEKPTGSGKKTPANGFRANDRRFSLYQIKAATSFRNDFEEIIAQIKNDNEDDDTFATVIDLLEQARAELLEISESETQEEESSEQNEAGDAESESAEYERQEGTSKSSSTKRTRDESVDGDGEYEEGSEEPPSKSSKLSTSDGSEEYEEDEDEPEDEE